MSHSDDEGPESSESESRVEGITVKVTASEKRDAQLVAALYGKDVGPMLRTRSLAEILEEAAAVKARHSPQAIA